MFREFALNLKRGEVQVAVTMMVQEGKDLYEKVKKKELTPDEAKIQFRDLIRKRKFAGNEYFFAYDANGMSTAHGLKIDMEGVDRSHSKDPNGKEYVQEFMAIARSGGDGFVSYQFEKVKGGTPVDKISYVKFVPEFNWIVGSGVYLDEVDAAMSEIRWKVNVGMFVLALIAFGLGWLVAKRIADRLIQISQTIAAESERLAQVAVRIAQVSEDLSTSSTEQAAALHQTSASLEETSSMVAKNSDNSQESLEVSNESHQAAERGQAVVQDMLRSMDSLEDSSDELLAMVQKNNAEMATITTVIQEIGQKTQVINDIVFQTKLLSFNASVEAARAGEHGKGFAVVADEVGKLAAMSGQSAQEITAMLQTSVQRVNEVAERSKLGMDRIASETRKKIQEGSATAQECNRILQDIVKNANRTAKMMGEISNASKEQTAGISQINDAVGQLENLSQKSKSGAEETSRTSDELKGQVLALRDTTAELYSEVVGLEKEQASEAIQVSISKAA